MSAFDLLRIFRAAVAAVEPRAAVARALTLDGGKLRAGEFSCDLAGVARIIVVGAGKAAAGMAAGVELVLGGRIEAGLVVVKVAEAGRRGLIAEVEAGHPLPDERGARAATRIFELVAGADAGTLVICLLSGGASALLVSPARGITLADKILTTELLLGSGADIAEINAVRKHLSAVKGGLLAAAARPARVLTLALSDVIGDRLDVIGSGPTYPDGSTYSEARETLGRRGLLKKVPRAVRSRLERGALYAIPETPKPGDPLFDGVGHCIVGSNLIALEAAAASARSQGYDVHVLTAEIQGEARGAARWLAGEARRVARTLAADAHPVCLLCGGETTVTVSGRGMGGRNQEFALAFALEIDGLRGMDLLSAGTDGIDGQTAAAGAFVDGRTARLAREVGLDPAASLRENDSHPFFVELDKRTGGSQLFVPGPSGTNVMDIQAVLVRPAEVDSHGRR
ncbi:MAG: glycerate kinase type-2 family protein [Candidatus Methylomirabilia bacterium]